MIHEASLSTSCQHIAGGPDAEEKTSVAIRSKFLLLQEGDMEKLHIGVGGNVRQAQECVCVCVCALSREDVMSM